MSLRYVQRARPTARALGLAGAFTMFAVLGALVLALGSAKGASAEPGGNGNGAAASAGSKAGGNGNGAAASAGSRAGGNGAAVSVGTNAGGNGAATSAGSNAGGNAGGGGGAGGAGDSGGPGGGSVASGGGTQGGSGSNPDGGGVDKPFPAAGQPAMSQGESDFDGNNGCGNDNDRSDDNVGSCGRKRGHFEDKPEDPEVTSTPPTTVLEQPVTPVVTETVVATGSDAVVPMVTSITHYSVQVSETESAVRTVTERWPVSVVSASSASQPIDAPAVAPAPQLEAPQPAVLASAAPGRVLSATVPAPPAAEVGIELAATVGETVATATPAGLPTPPVSTSAAPALAFTGTPVRGLLQGGISLILLGLVSLLVARPRREVLVP